MLVGWACLVLLWLLAMQLLRLCLDEDDVLILVSGGFGLAGILLTLAGALLLPWLSPQATLAALALVSLIALLAARDLPKPPLSGEIPWRLLGASLPGAALIAFYSLFIQSVSLVVEDGFFVHTTNMGMIVAGHFPPLNFQGEPLQGHYGKDLVTALLSLASGADFLTTEWISTTLIQLAHFTLLLSWIRQQQGALAAWLCAHMTFLASAFGSHVGLADTITNNNAVAFFALTLCLYLLWGSVRQQRLRAALLAGVALGVDALIYEVHFGLLGLTLATFCVPVRGRWKNFVLTVSVALVLACVEGGVLTHMARKAVWGAPPRDRKTSWQSQAIELKFPKDDIFVLRRDNLRPSRFFEGKLRPYEADFQPSRAVAPLWDRAILSCFWYPFWLAPLVAAALFWRRNELGAWMWVIGGYSVLTPCLVSFGYFENETGRWLFVGALAASQAYALALAQAWTLPRGVGKVLLVWTVWFNLPALPLEFSEMRQALAHPGQPLADGSPGIVAGAGLIPQPRLSLAYHYRFRDADWAAVSFLHTSARGQGLFLANYPDDPPPPGDYHVELASGNLLNLIGLQSGLSGLRPAGISGAPPNRWSPPLFSQSLQARLFWADPSEWRLRALGARWLLIDESTLEPTCLEKLAHLPVRELYAQAGRRIYEVTRSQSPPPPASSLELRSGQAPQQLAPRAAFPLQLELAGQGEGLLRWRFRERSSGEIATPEVLLTRSSAPTGGATLVGPYYEGSYELQWSSEADPENWKTLLNRDFREVRR